MTEARQSEVRELLATIKNKQFYELRDPKQKEAITKIQALGADAGPALAELLADGLQTRKQGWIQVYRPLYILEGLGEHARVALSDVIKALDDEHSINVMAATRVLGKIGPAAKDALPKLIKVWAAETEVARKNVVGTTIKAIDPKAAEKLGIE